MSFNSKILDPEQVEEFLDRARKVGVKADTSNRFLYLSENDEKEEFAMEKQFYQYFFKTFSENEFYRNAVLPQKTSVPAVYFSNEEFGEEWKFHRDDFEQEDMTREYSVVLSLSDEYEGGEMVVLRGGIESTMKLPKGYMAIFPSDTYVKFEKVTSGERVLCRWATEVGIKDHTHFEINLRYQQLFNAFQGSLSPQAEEMFFLANNMLANNFMKKVD